MMGTQEFEITKEFKRLRITPYEATEFDQSLNDATRRDINRFVDEYGNNIMGVSLWDFKMMQGEELRDALNFSVNYLFKADDLERVTGVIDAYKEHKNAKMFLDEMEMISVYTCFWV